jgi:hypothetical protein
MYLHLNRGMEEKLTTTQETVGFGWPQFGSPSRRYFTSEIFGHARVNLQYTWMFSRVPSIFSVRNDLLLALNNKQAHMTATSDKEAMQKRLMHRTYRKSELSRISQDSHQESMCNNPRCISYRGISDAGLFACKSD